MNRFICSVVFILIVSVAFAQKVYFVYLESESQQPFFAKLRDKTYPSSASGYVILSNLRDSSYTITIGFPSDKWPEQQFTVPTRAKDRGFLLKNFGEKGWGLFDLQTLSIQMPDGHRKEGAAQYNKEAYLHLPRYFPGQLMIHLYWKALHSQKTIIRL